MKTYCLTLDLKDDPALIAEYRRYHEPGTIWPEVIDHIRNQGILSQEIYLLGTRLVLILCTTDEFSLARKAEADRTNSKIQEWEELMWEFQQALPQAVPGEKWMPMEKIFSLDPEDRLHMNHRSDKSRLRDIE